MTNPTTALTEIGPIQQALVAATEAGDVARLRDVSALASALQKGARARGMGIEAENQAAEVVIRAERAIGGALNTLAEAGLRTLGGGYAPYTTNPESIRRRERARAKGQRAQDDMLTLSDFGLTPNQSARFRLIAALTDEEFEALIAAHRERGERIAKVNFYSAAKPKDKAAEAARHEIMDAWHSEDATKEFAAFGKAVEALIPKLTSLPTDELADVAVLVQRLAAEYQLARVERNA